MKKYHLSIAKRDILGKKTKKLRQQKIIPANIYGKKIKSMAVQVPLSDFAKVYAEAGETGLVELKLGDKNYTVLIANIQQHPVTSDYWHIDFHQVDLKEKIHTHVPIEVIGIAPAVEQKKGIMLNILDELEVEALPTDLPEKISIKVAELKEVGNSIKVSDVQLPVGVVALAKGEMEIVKIGALLTKEAEKLAAEEAAAKAAAAAQAAATATPAEGAPATAATPKEAVPTTGKPATEVKTEAKPAAK